MPITTLSPLIIMTVDHAIVTPGSVPAGRRPGRRRGVTSILLLAVVAAMTITGWVILVGLVVPQHLQLGARTVGIGLGITAYALGVRHAFDADHIAAIDNTTRKLLADGRPTPAVGFWFALGHSSVVVLLAAGIATGAHLVVGLTEDGSAVRKDLGLVSTLASGLFLVAIGVINLIALVSVVRLYRSARSGRYDEDALERTLDRRGLITRLLRPLIASIRHPAQMYLVGLLFGVGFDTATEVTLLVLAGSGAAVGLPWYAIMVMPMLFTAGMTLFDTLDGMFMRVAYGWAFANPIRKLYYNLTITALSVAVAVLIGSVELISVLHDRIGWTNRVSDRVAGLDLGNVGYLVAATFVVVWVGAVGYWKTARVEEKWLARNGEPIRAEDRRSTHC